MGLHVKSTDKPDERRDFALGHVEVTNLPGIAFGKSTFDPGWKWSECVKPIAGTDSCQFHHYCYVVSGRMRLRLDDGTEMEAGPGDLFNCPPGHDAWVVGGEQCVVYDWGGSAPDYAKA